MSTHGRDRGCCVAIAMVVAAPPLLLAWVLFTAGTGHPGIGIEYRLLNSLAKGIEAYLADSGGILPVVKEGETVIDALYPNYIELADDLKESIGMGGKSSYYVFRQEFSGKNLAELEEGVPIVVRTEIPLPGPRNVSRHYEIVKYRESVLVLSK